MTNNRDKQIAELNELDKKRTQGEWMLHSHPTCDPVPLGIMVTATGGLDVCVTDFRGTETTVWDAEFILRAPQMIKIINEQQAEIKALTKNCCKQTAVIDRLKECAVNAQDIAMQRLAENKRLREDIALIGIVASGAPETLHGKSVSEHIQRIWSDNLFDIREAIQQALENKESE